MKLGKLCKVVTIIAVVAVVALVAVACAGSQPATGKNAAALFASHCARCHGQNREGISGLGPPLNPASLAGLSYDEVQVVISSGGFGGGMPAFSGALSPEEIKALAQFIKDTTP